MVDVSYTSLHSITIQQLIPRTNGLSSECLNQHIGIVHTADLGDGQGQVPENYLAREWFFHPIYGTCWETLTGGNHFRAWKQAGTEAWFLACVIYAIRLKAIY
jgi:hypothetical protein